MPTLNYDDDPEWTPKGVRKARKKHLKAEVAVFDGSWDDLDQLKDASITVKGKKIFVKKGDYIRVAGEGMAVMEDGDGYNESAMWVGRVERIGRESPDTLEVGTRTPPIWLEVYWLYSKEDIKDIANKSGNKKLLCALEPFGSLERACSVKADTVSLNSVLGLAHVVTFDDRLVSSESGDIDHSTFYVRTDFDYEKEELSRSDNLKPCPCAIGTCKDSYYCPAEDFSQVFCANFGCCLWYHASCVAGTTNSSWYPTPECYTNGRILSVPEPTLQGRSVHPSDAHDFDRTQMFGKLWFISRRYSTLLFALAEQPIVRPTLTSVTGNMADVLKAREFIRDVRFDIINKEGEMEMKRWLGGMKLASVERDAREARARAGGVKKAELESAMREDRDYEQLVCPQCGHPM